MPLPRRTFFLYSLGSLGLALRHSVAFAGLQEFVRRIDPAYRYEVGQTWQEGDVAFTNLRLTSQVFQGTPWHHVLTIARPQKLATTNHALLLIGGGRHDELPPFNSAKGQTGTKQRETLRSLASASQLLTVMVEQVPDQPLFGGKIEDESIAFTIGQFLQSGDSTWPLLQPMVKSAISAMDAVQDYSQQHLGTKVEGFTVSGESKRGWTTWLTAAVDDRVKALLPMVFDMLNIPAQLQHQIDTWGALSEQLGDYEGLPAMLATPRGQELLKLIDPFAYKDTLLQPKLIILGTNDRYWPVDAANLYAPLLKGPTYLLYLTNAGHNFAEHPLVEKARVVMSLAAAGKLQLPTVRTALQKTATGASLIALSSDVTPSSLTVMQARSLTKDFRDAVWKEKDKLTVTNALAYPVAPQSDRYTATFLTAVFPLNGHDFTVTSNVVVMPPSSPG